MEQLLLESIRWVAGGGRAGRRQTFSWPRVRVASLLPMHRHAVLLRLHDPGEREKAKGQTPPQNKTNKQSKKKKKERKKLGILHLGRKQVYVSHKPLCCTSKLLHAGGGTADWKTDLSLLCARRTASEISGSVPILPRPLCPCL